MSYCIRTVSSRREDGSLSKKPQREIANTERKPMHAREAPNSNRKLLSDKETVAREGSGEKLLELELRASYMQSTSSTTKIQNAYNLQLDILKRKKN